MEDGKEEDEDEERAEDVFVLDSPVCCESNCVCDNFLGSILIKQLASYFYNKQL